MRRLTLTTLLVVIIALAGAATADARSVTKAVGEIRLLITPEAERNAYLDEIANQLHASFVRIDVSWNVAEPARDSYDDAYLANLKATVDAARARGLHLLVNVVFTPEWASDHSLWSDPPAGYTANVYDQCYAIDPDSLPDLQVFASYLATMLGPEIRRYECWNEPNLWPYIWPQRKDGDKYFAARVYNKMLRAFSLGIRAANPDALVVGGATGPIGFNTRYSTSPQRFAGFLRRANAGRYLDIYSHHPYTPGASANMAPDGKPNNPQTTVTLYNIKTLLDMFPAKPFYLSEYGYNTQATMAFGGSKVSEATQALYLRRAYSLAAKFRQVSMLFWYQVQDISNTGSYDMYSGVYTGLRNLNGSRKPAWDAFVGGNHLTLSVPSRATSGSAFWISGALTNVRLGALEGRPLVIQRHYPGGCWTTVSKVSSNSAGSFRISAKQRRGASWRVAYRGVASSPTMYVGAK